MENGEKIKNKDVTLAPHPSKRYWRFCSDTSYKESIVNEIQGVDVLYHEATFLNSS